MGTALRQIAAFAGAGVFFLCLALLPASGTAQVALPEPGTLTANELITRANAAYSSGDYESAEALFLAFERDYGNEPQVAEIVRKNYALIALCKITNGRASEAGPYIEKALQQADLPRDIREELAFWAALQLLQDNEWREAQEAFGAFFQETDFTYTRRLEALTLFGTCYVLQGYHRTAAEFFRHQVPNLRKARGGKPFASRGVVMRMIALQQSEQFGEALRLLEEEFPRMEELDQIVSFQTMALGLGSHFMEREDYYSAIACLQRIWPRDRLIAHQEEKLARLRARREALAGDPKMQSVIFQLDGTIRRVERELENFREIENFDAALRLRLAMAFQRLERYREAALIMEDMLQRMEISPVVESASMAVIQCWSQLERWPRALEAAENYLIAFGDQPENKNLPQVLYMQADAMMKLQLNGDAEAVFGNLAASFPDHPLAAKALFLKGFCQLLQDENDEAIASFDEVLARGGSNASVEEDAFYWKGMAHSFAQRYEEAFAHMGDYLERYGDRGIKYEPEAVFRRAYCVFCQADYVGAIDRFREFLDEYGDVAADRDEAWLLLGDALLGEGRADEGLAAYASIDPESTRFFEDGYFKTGQAYKLLEEIPRMRSHYQSFLEKYPESQRMPEAVYWIGWTHVHGGEPEKAREVYWDTIRKHGNTPELFSIEELFLALPRLYRRAGPEGMSELTRDLQMLYIEADREERVTLAVRALWADAMLKREQGEVASAEALLLRIDTLIDPEIHNPQIVADVADALVENDRLAEAADLYRELRRWNPLSFHKARAYRGLGRIAELEGRTQDAIEQYREYERRAALSTDLAEIILRRVRLEIDEGSAAGVVTDLEALLESPVASAENKAEALFLIGEHLTGEAEYLKATAYYERVYLVYGKYRDLVAQAYYRRGQALEKLGKLGEAYEVYAELAGREDLREFRESGLGRRKMDELESHKPATEEPTGVVTGKGGQA